MEDSNQLTQNGASNRALNSLEYASLAAAVAGTIASVITQQVVFAAAPLSLSVFLNLMNRNRMDRLSLENNQVSLSRMRALSQELQTYKQQLGQGTTAATPASIPELAEVKTHLSELQQQYTDLERAWNNLSAQLQHRLSELSPESDPVLVDLPAIVQASEQRISQLEQQVALGLTAAAASSPSLDLVRVQTEIEAIALPLRQHLATLEERLEQITTAAPPTPGVESSDAATLGQFQEQLHNLNAQVETALTTLSEALTGIPATVSATVAQHLAQVNLAPAAAIAAEDLDELQNLANQIENSLDKIAEGFTTIPTLFEGTQERLVGTLQQRVADPVVLEELQQQLSNLDLKLEMSLAELSTHVQGIPALVEDLTRKHQQAIPQEPASTTSSEQTLEMLDLDSLLSDLQ